MEAARFVETYMAIVANTQYLQVYAAGIGYHLLVFAIQCCFICSLGNSPLKMCICIGVNVYMVKKVTVHKAVIALISFFFYRIIFIEVEGDHVLKA